MIKKRGSKGSVSIFLVIILVPMITVASLFVDASKVDLARGLVSSASDLTLNTALTNYDTKLKDLYGLFATAQDCDELYERLEDYYYSCMSSSGLSEEEAGQLTNQVMGFLHNVENQPADDLLNIQVVDFNISKNKDMSLANPAMLKRQIVEFMKYRSPINTGLSFLTSLQSFKTLSAQADLVDKRQQYYEAEEDVMVTLKSAWDNINNYNNTKIVKESTDLEKNSYLNNVQVAYGGSKTCFETLSKLIIMDLYHTKDLHRFDENMIAKIKFEPEKIPVNGDDRMEYIYYIDNKKQKNFTELNVFSSSHKATAKDVKEAMDAVATSYNNYQEAKAKLDSYLKPTPYPIQCITQLRRNKIYDNFCSSIKKLYIDYRYMRHAMLYPIGDEMSQVHNVTLGHANFERKLNDLYKEIKKECKEIFENFSKELGDYNGALIRASKESVDKYNESIIEKDKLIIQLKFYKESHDNVVHAIDYLGNAIQLLNKAKTQIKGELAVAKNNWQKATTNNVDIANSTLTKQDQAELENITSYLNVEDIEALITRLQNIKGNLEHKVLQQMENFKFFDKPIWEYPTYESVLKALETNLTKDKLENVPIQTDALEAYVKDSISGKFQPQNSKGKNIVIKWQNDSGTEPLLNKNMLRFYRYLFTHFNKGDIDNNSTEQKEVNKSQGTGFYKQIKESGKDSVNNVSEGNDNLGKSMYQDRVSTSYGGAASFNADENKTQSMKETSKGLSGMFDDLPTTGEHLRDKLFVADYVLSMLSYDTIEKEVARKNKNNPDNAKPKTLTLQDINKDNNYAYRREAEYIIYGEDEFSTCVNKAYGSIYGVRLGFNLIYAFSTSEIRDTAFALATPISAASLGVLPVPLVQAAIVVGIACIESGLDLASLKNGESVPLFKNNQTWRTSVTGIAGEIRSELSGQLSDVMTTVGESAIDSGVEKLTELLDKTDVELSQYLNENRDEILKTVNASFDSLVDRYSGMVVQKLNTLCKEAIERYKLDPKFELKQYVSNGLDSWLNSEKNSGASDIKYIVKEQAVLIIKQSYIDPMISRLLMLIDKEDCTIVDYNNSIVEVLSRIKSDLNNRITLGCDKVLAYKDKMRKNIEEAMSNGASALKDKLTSTINGAFGDGVGSDGQTATASLLSFSYKDYMRLFLIVGLCTNQEGTLLRTADAIQANMRLQTKKEDYKLENSSCYVNLDTKVLVKPTLLGLPLFADIQNNPVNNQGWYTINLSTMKGY